MTFTAIVDGRAVEGPADVRSGRVRLSPGAAWSALGLTGRDEVDLVEVAAGLDRPLALDVDEQAAFLGVSARARAERLRSLEAPDFTLPDLDGRPHRLSEHRGRKVLMVAYGSW